MNGTQSDPAPTTDAGISLESDGYSLIFGGSDRFEVTGDISTDSRTAVFQAGTATWLRRSVASPARGDDDHGHADP